MHPAGLQVDAFIHAPSGTISYLIFDPATRECAVIDSVLDFDAKSGRTATTSADEILARVEALGARVTWILETHIHADHLSAAPYLREKSGGWLAVGEQITRVQHAFGGLFNAGPDFARDGSQFDHLLADGATLRIGQLTLTAMHTPGHTPACMTYLVSDGKQQAAFVGDTLFMPDYGTARCDFPGGDARTLYRSIGRVLALPADTILYMCHDYCPGGRPFRYASTVAEQRAANLHVREGISEDDFVQMRETRDATLEMPALILPSVQVNMRAGRFPKPEDNGIRYLKLPLDVL
jgi:glyoxylase-like metal-dependent hydrolase (beta-lactamase superfamily II)